MESERVFPGRERFFSFERPYKLVCNREDGERILAKVAAIEPIERMWAFDADSSVWFYYPAKVLSQIIDYSEGGKHEIEVPAALMAPPGNNSSLYHTHTTHDEQGIVDTLEQIKSATERAYATLVVQLPSAGDLYTCALASEEGYKDIRIVTRIGVTTVEFSPQKERTDYDVALSQEQLIQVIEKEGLLAGINAAVDIINLSFRPNFNVRFEPLNI